MKKLKSVLIIGIILFVGILLLIIGIWIVFVIVFILKMRIKDVFMGVFFGNLLLGVIVLVFFLYII